MSEGTINERAVKSGIALAWYVLLMAMRLTSLWLLIAIGVATEARANPFADLRAAYAARDAAAAARVYTPTGSAIYRYEATPEERYTGTSAIESSFRAFFAQVDPKQAIDLNFRITSRTPRSSDGVYRLRIGRLTASYGRFAVTIGSDGKFSTDLSTTASVWDFEGANGPVLLAADDETLDRNFYGKLTGRYRLQDGCDLVVTRSVVRLFVRNTCSHTWRGLNRVSGREWTAGDRVRSDKPDVRYVFADPTRGSSATVEVYAGSERQVAARRDAYRVKDVAFMAADGTELRGSVYVPMRASQASRRFPASVLIHGSGPQDRNGYASIIAVIADELATNGRVVLTYDKRGSGESAGDGDRADFDILASDVTAAMAAVSRRPDVDPNAVGLAGSSQAGWVAARAIQNGARPADVLLLGAAGAALTVAEQNLYNTEVRMRCARLAEGDIALALDQQRAFFGFLADPGAARTLDELSAKARARPALSEWLFPDSRSVDRAAGAWYVVLDPRLDPLPTWRGYRGRTSFLFGQYDDATPTTVAINRLSKTAIRSKVLIGAQHLGLMASQPCKAELTDVDSFSPELMREIARFARGSGSPER
ncbi:MAG: alpha/beta hydrolase [Sphingomicrobium sp.]